MKKMKWSCKENSMKEVNRIRTMMFLSWAFSIVIPIVLIIAVNIMTYGTHALNVVFKPDFFNRQVYQLYELNPEEYLAKRIDNVIVGRPSQETLEVAIHAIVEDMGATEMDGRHGNVLLLVRKEDQILMSDVIGEELTAQELERFEHLPDDILPVFQPGRATKNEVIFHTTGYVIGRQQDFYFEDGTEGSIFQFHKYTNIPGKVASTIGRNLFYVIVMMFLLHILMAYIMSKKITKPVNAIVMATEEVSSGNYDYQIPVANQPMLSNISESINAMIQELDKGKQFQDRIERVRSEFIANQSHDMKTPLTSIKIHAQAIKDGIVTTPDKLERYVDNILLKTNDMDYMLDELKVYNELELGTGNYDMQSINFKYFLEDAIEELRYDVDSEHIQLQLSFAEDIQEAWLNFDPKKIKRVLNNITFNAVKYAKVRPLEIYFELKRLTGEQKKSLQLTVSDNGVGVEASEYDKLFIQHYRVDPARNQTISGSGLGLSIAQSIVEHHGGKIVAQKSAYGGLAIVIQLDCEVS